MLEVKGLSLRYGRHLALQDVAIAVGGGETVAILGANGGGKSSLLKAIAGIARPDDGAAIRFRGEPLTGRPAHEIVELGIAMVPEGRGVFPELTVEENLLLGAYRKDARPDIERNLEASYEAFPVLRERRRQQVASLSGGEQQMVALSRALMSSPKILLVDEPSVGLAPILVSRMIAKIKELQEQNNLTVLIAEQNFNQAIKIADRGYIMVHGEIAFEGKSADALRENELIKRYYLGA